MKVTKAGVWEQLGQTVALRDLERLSVSLTCVCGHTNEEKAIVRAEVRERACANCGRARKVWRDAAGDLFVHGPAYEKGGSSDE